MKPIPDLNIGYLSHGRGFGGERHRGAVRRLPFVRNAGTTAVEEKFSHLLWYIFETSTDETLKVAVSEGLLLVSDWRSIAVDGSWGGMRVLKQVNTISSEHTVSNGATLWLKIEFVMSDGSSYRAQFQAIDDSIPTSVSTDVALVTTSDASDVAFQPHTHEADHSHTITLKTGGANALSAQLLTTYKKYSTYSWQVVHSGDPDPTDSDEEVYVKFASFTVTAGVLSIQQHVVGCPITVPLVAVTWGDGIGD